MHGLRLIRKLGYGSTIITFAICLVYATLDEIHQLFVPGRGAQVRDVFIDSAGAAVGIIVYWVIMKLKYKNTPAESD